MLELIDTGPTTVLKTSLNRRVELQSLQQRWINLIIWLQSVLLLVKTTWGASSLALVLVNVNTILQLSSRHLIIMFWSDHVKQCDKLLVASTLKACWVISKGMVVESSMILSYLKRAVLGISCSWIWNLIVKQPILLSWLSLHFSLFRTPLFHVICIY